MGTGSGWLLGDLSCIMGVVLLLEAMEFGIRGASVQYREKYGMSSSTRCLPARIAESRSFERPERQAGKKELGRRWNGSPIDSHPLHPIGATIYSLAFARAKDVTTSDCTSIVGHCLRHRSFLRFGLVRAGLVVHLSDRFFRPGTHRYKFSS